MGSADWLKNVIGMRKAKDGRSKKLKLSRPHGASDKNCTLKPARPIIIGYPAAAIISPRQPIPSIFLLQMLESPEHCKINWIHIFSLGQGTSAIKKSIGCKGEKETSKITNGVLVNNQRELAMPIEDRAAIKIQTAFRAYVARKTLRRLKGNTRLQSLTQRLSVKKQASSALNYICSWNTMQNEIRARRVHMVMEGHLKRKKHENQLKLETKLQNIEIEWSGGPETMEVILARIHQREEAAIKRERAMAYAFTHQWRANSNPAFGSGNNEMSKANWGWSWTDRWVAARPWESRVLVHASLKKVSDKAIKNTKSITSPPKKTPVSVKLTSLNGKGTIKAKRSNEIATQKASSKVKESSSDKQEVVTEAKR